MAGTMTLHARLAGNGWRHHAVGRSTTNTHASVRATGNNSLDIYSFTVAAANTRVILGIDFGAPNFDSALWLFHASDLGNEVRNDYDTTALAGAAGSVADLGGGISNDSFIEQVVAAAGSEQHPTRAGPVRLSRTNCESGQPVDVSSAEVTGHSAGVPGSRVAPIAEFFVPCPGDGPVGPPRGRRPAGSPSMVRVPGPRRL